MSEGSERLAYGMTELMCDGEHYEAVGTALVAKEGKDERDLLMDPFKYHRNVCRSQIKSRRYAAEFNRLLAGMLSPDEVATTPVITFVNCSVYRVNTPDGSAKEFLVEKRLDMKRWAKFNNNSTFVMKEEEFAQRYPLDVKGVEEEEEEEVSEEEEVEEVEEEEVLEQAQDEDEEEDELQAPPAKRRVTFDDRVEIDGEWVEDEQEYDEDVGHESDINDEARDLPTGWESCHDSKSGRVFYHNKSLNVSQWEYPGRAESPGSSPARSCSFASSRGASPEASYYQSPVRRAESPGSSPARSCSNASPDPRGASPGASYYQSPNDRRMDAETLWRGGGDSQSPPRMRSRSPPGARLLIPVRESCDP
jgi:hypothetical protein